MKKSLIFITLFIITSKLMAQKATITPFDNTIGNKLLKAFKPDSNWRVNPPALATDKLFKQPDIDVSKLNVEDRRPLLIAADGYNMPILNLNNTSKTPIVVLDGNSKMPILGKNMTKAKRLTIATPAP